METSLREKEKSVRYTVILVILGIGLNTALSFLMFHYDLPLYLDTAGTVVVSCLAGVFPGIITALGTNFFCLLFNESAAYYSILNVLIAIATSWFYRRDRLKKGPGIIMFILTAVFIGGGMGAVIQWVLLGKPQFQALEDTARALSPEGSNAIFVVFFLLNLGLNIVDKGVTVIFALIVMGLLPERVKDLIERNISRQKPLSDSEVKELRKRTRRGERSLLTRMTVMITLCALTLTVMMGIISLRLYYESVQEEYTDTAIHAARFAAEIVDGDKVDEYLRKGEAVPGYEETKRTLYNIRENARGLEYLYVVKIRNDGCYFIFDLDTEGVEAYEPGERVQFEEAFLPYVPKLLEGEEIEPIISNDFFGWLLTVYCPVKNSDGETVCYAGADVSLKYLSDFARDYLLKTFLIFSGVFILVLSYGLWVSRSFLVYPINSMAKAMEGFGESADDQEAFEENVNRLRDVDIRTGDEVEKLYRGICSMAMNTAEHVRGIRYYAQANERMQNGLIITMANMVENRDSDTGAHVLKTSAYVKIILNGLRAKGYYAEKLSDKYISDVEMSAPLHDVGKINIPDAVLNKPGKLTDEEYEIMKTHTTAGKKILENAIGTVEGENYLKEARNMAAYHHERWDGKGYPEGLHGEVIPLSARVMAIADVFDALASPRIYKPAFPVEKALSIIEEGAGTQFDPKCVEVFLESKNEVLKVLKKYQEKA